MNIKLTKDIPSIDRTEKAAQSTPVQDIQAKKPLVEAEAIAKPKGHKEAVGLTATNLKQKPPSSGMTSFQVKINTLTKAMKSAGKVRNEAADEALSLASSYPMRRSQGARHKAIQLCGTVAKEVPEKSATSKLLGSVLQAEGFLADATAESTLRACRILVETLDAPAESF
ncbi:hypothetical protein KAI87_07015 [Myxococcota bacterium]|nr:hypothetical protein [Myxococcota bacterium]